MTTIILQRFANREYRLTAQSILSGGRKGGDKYKEVQGEKYAKAVHDIYVLSQSFNQGQVADIDNGQCRLSAFGEVNARQGLRALDIISEFQQTAGTRAKGGWGALSRPTAFTRNARHRLLEAGAIVDAGCGKDAWEITLTLPGSTEEAKRTLAAHSGWIINRLLREVTREKCLHWFYVWELQKRGALHLHLLVAGLGNKTKTLAHSIEYHWWELLWELSDRTGIDLFKKSENKTWKYESSVWQSHTAQVQKSVAAYFAKYASKESSKKSRGFTSRRNHCPSRWWGCSSYLKTQIANTRKKYTLNISKLHSKEIMEHLQTWLDSPGRIRRYEYEFQLGKTANGTELGGGHVCINYYNDGAFARMQTWEKYVWEECQEITRRHGYADMGTQTWTDADMACPTPLEAALAQRRHDLSNADMQTRRSPPSPPSQPILCRSQLSKSRGTQPKATLELRALLVQYLAGGDGGAITKVQDNYAQADYVQGTLFDTSCYESIDRSGRSYEI